MTEYNFESIDAKRFEQLAAALGQVHIARGLRPFGSGTDGGREATFEGRMDYPSAVAVWDGYLVVQCKRKESRGATPKDEADWAINQLDDEMEKYSTAKIPRRIPEYFLFVTNAELSAKLGDGGKDRFVARLKHWVDELGIRDADVWDRDKLSALLNTTQVVAQRFGFLHAGDLIHYAAENVLAHRKGVETTLSLFLQEELRVDQYVRLAQAGHVGDERTPLARVFVDLRASESLGNHVDHLVVEAVQRASDRPLNASLLEIELGTKPDSEHVLDGSEREMWLDSSKFVLVGGPGQGKSTLIQHLAQRHRAALLSRHAAASLGYEIRDIVRITKESAEESEIGLPRHPRFPFRIVLEQFADSLAKGETDSVLDFISFLMRKRTSRPFNRDDVEQLLRQVPCFVAFDGLDEVPAASNRGQVITAVRLFIGEARAMDADLLVVGTTRPQGYEDEFSPRFFNHLYLVPLEKGEALNYASKFVQTKYAADADRRERVLSRLETAAGEDATARLMISPLQVTIMAALVDIVGNPPRERYPLFARYYDVVYQREQERGLGSSEILAEYRSDIDALHDRVGLLLQIATETAGRTQSRISGQRLRELAVDRLRAGGHEGKELERITQSLVEVALKRLVFIVPLEEDQYGFEVRSLQEFAAARSLMRRGSPEQIKQRLWAIAPVPYWRNTVLFAVGLVFAEREDLSDTIAQLCRELNEDEEDPALFHTRAGSRLALDILKDGVVDRRPRHRRSLLETALLLLEFPELDSAIQLAAFYRQEDEARYTAAARAAFTHRPGKGAGVFVLLARLASLDISWSKSLLEELWPIDLREERWAFEHSAAILTWEAWLIKRAIHVARESMPQWVRINLGRYAPVSWIEGTLQLDATRHGDGLEIRLWGNDDAVRYYCETDFPSLQVLEDFARAEPVHRGWAPYIHGRDFIVDPNAETLCQSLKALVENGGVGEDPSLVGLPWPLQTLLASANSDGELELFAQRACTGVYGDVEDWKAAEKRWSTRGFQPDDLTCFADEEWPYTKRISEQGIVPMPLSARQNESGLSVSLEGLRTAFSTASSKRTRQMIADDLCFCLSVASGEPQIEVQPFSVQEVINIAQSSRWWLDGLAVISILARSPQLLVDSAGLTVLGERVTLPGSRAAVKRRGNSVHLEEDLFSPVATRVAEAFSTRLDSDGAIRLIASFAVLGATLPSVSIKSDKFTSGGFAALTAFELFTEGAGGTSPADIARVAIDNWTYRNSITNQQEIPALIQRLTPVQLSPYAVQVIDIVLRSHVMGRVTSKMVLQALNSVNQYRTSQLGDVNRQTSLGL